MLAPLRLRLVQMFHPRYSITARLGLTLGCVTILIAILESSLLLPLLQNRLKALTKEQMHTMAVQLAYKLDRSMFERYREMQILATLDSIRNTTIPLTERRALLDTLQKTYPAYAWIGVTDTQGKVVASTQGLLLGSDVSARPWFQKALQGPYVGDVHDAVLLAKLIPHPSNEPLRLVDISMPIHDAQGRVQGVLGAHLNWSWARELQESLLAPSNQQGIDLILFNQAGEVILNARPDENQSAATGNKAVLTNGALATEEGTWADEKRYVTGIAHSQGYDSYSGLGWSVVARQPVAIAFAPIYEIGGMALLGHGTTIALCIVLTWFFVQQLARPLREIAAAADVIRTGKSTHSLPLITGYDEVARLSQSLTTLVAALTAHESLLKEQNSDLQHELSERHKAETALRRSEELFRLLVEGVRDYAIVMLDVKGQVNSWHTGAEQITGYTAEDMLGQPLARLFPVEDVTQDSPDGVLQQAQSEERYENECWLVRADETRFLAHVVVTPLTNGTHKLHGYVIVLQDITQRKRIDEQLTRAQKMDGIGQLAGGIAHDFNNVLTAISGYADLIQETSSADSPIFEDAREIQNAAERGAALTRQLLTFARQQTLLPQTINLNDLVYDVEKMLRRLLPADITLDLRLSPAPCYIKVDIGKIEQVVVNLAVNARDAMPAGGILAIETSSLLLESQADNGPLDVSAGSYIQLAVSDTGTGIPPEIRARVFEPFFTTKEQGKGTGLGLATCYGIIKQHGGTIWLYSEVDHGTVVKVYLPEVSDELSDQQNQVQMQPTVLAPGNETILVVEDDNAVRTMAVRILRSCGYTVFEATNGEEAVHMVEQHNPGLIHLLLTDLMMPIIGGTATASQITQHYPSLKVLFMSGYTEQSVAQQRQLDTPNAMIQKPFTPLILAQKVRNILDS